MSAWKKKDYYPLPIIILPWPCPAPALSPSAPQSTPTAIQPHHSPSSPPAPYPSTPLMLYPPSFSPPLHSISACPHPC
ncbi:hypothetical protein E2C01_097166 [Portunus trituberculatus]|uniref:Uncharacterized protein n=1 Tax=Portunus trituberculatus TaxID=210409 RepID=A0A5B7K3T5_PORTR|nr:hypothetical protein [Portunus trituberculatus]